jgi:hypothetical protein
MTYGGESMSSEAREHEFNNYNRELVQLMKEHDLICPEEEEQIMSYLWMTH